MNPADIIWADATTADAAAKGAGLATFGVPEALAIGDLEFTPPRFAYAGGVAQATYETPATMFVVRKGTSTHKAPLTDRDTASFAQTWNQTIDGLNVTLYGPEQDQATVATWEDGGQSYGLTFQGLGGEEMTMDADTLASLVSDLKASNARQTTQSGTQSQGTQGAGQNAATIQEGDADTAATTDDGNAGNAGAEAADYTDYSYSGGSLDITEGEAVELVQNYYGGTYAGSDYVETQSYGPCWYVATTGDDGVTYGFYVDGYGNVYAG